MNKLKARLAPFTFKVMLMHSYLNEEKVSLRIKRTSICSAADKAVLCGYCDMFVGFVKLSLKLLGQPHVGCWKCPYV